ncbi:pectin esterase [Streptomyces hoynatensis]|uniref:Pectin esterase n=1 Tax=Streptomyces hoynatensis TaxID=1141874 RepID=A0A3A9YSB0_9ACTN|nr:pectin esterase [Streptomyces hoynatensis]
MPAAGGTYQLKVTNGGRCIDVPAASHDSGVKLQQWGCTENSPWQQFTLVSAGSGRYLLQNTESGKCIDVTGGSTAVGTRLQQWGCAAGQANQQWSLTASGTGTYRLTSASSGLCIAVQGASTTNGAAIIQDTCTDNSNKQWLFSPVGGAGGPYTVAADGTGTYRTVQAAIDAVGTGNSSRVTLTIKAGTYREKVTVPSNKPYITLQGMGDSPDDVLIVNNYSAGEYGTAGSATVVAQGHDFAATNLTISNDFDESTRPSGQQALALYLDADRSVLDGVRLLGDQDTLQVHDDARAYVTGSYIEGTVDFIYGGGTAVFSDCDIYEKRSTGGPITAASTPAENTYGFLFYRSSLTGATNNTTQLGRPWRADAQVLYRESSLSASIATAQPWSDMSGNSWENARFLEYRNTGPGATVNGNRPQLPDSQAAAYTPQRYLAGSDGWNPVG